MEDILKLIINYSQQEKIADENFMRKIIEIMIDIKNINNYVSKFELSSLDKHETAIYLSGEKTVRVYDNSIKLISNKLKKFIPLLEKDELILLYNLLIVQIILHELEHAEQYKIMDNEENMEAFILRVAYGVDEETAFKLYEFAPNERLAEIKSFEEIAFIIIPIKEEYPNILEFVHISVLEKKLRGYHYNSSQGISSLLIKFFLETYNTKKLKLFDWFDFDSINCLKLSTSKYSTQERLEYGMPISLEEYSNIGRRILLSKKYSNSQQQ